ncbi:MAG: rhomboid family intramembrane serine protease, partial [Candidatus Eremiobacteraeota bacterium]|nr:rhomboid family intramembrane serine protease [Candidatus Eremiobacteraeota bacterium]
MTIIVLNVIVFIIELMNGDQFVLHWSMVNADVSAGHRPITLLTSMFLHA